MEATTTELLKPGRLEQFRTQGLVNVVYGTSTLRFRDDRLYNRIVDVLLSGKINDFIAQGLATVVYSLHAVGFRREDFLERVVRDLSEDGGMPHFDVPQVGGLVWGGRGEVGGGGGFRRLAGSSPGWSWEAR